MGPAHDSTGARDFGWRRAPRPVPLAMPFGFSMGEVVVTLGVVAVAFGPKDVPVIARGLGRAAGQAVGAVLYLSARVTFFTRRFHATSRSTHPRTRLTSRKSLNTLNPNPLPGYVGLMSANADKLARNARVHELHLEMKTSVSDLVGVTNEIRRGMDPLTVGREMMAKQERNRVSKESTSKESTSFSSSDTNRMSATDSSTTERTSSNQFQPAAARAMSAHQSGRNLSTANERFDTTSRDSLSGPSHLPFSALSLGRIKRQGPAIGGGDILSDSLDEQRVAADAFRLAATGQLNDAVSKRTDAFRMQGDQVVNDR